MKGKLFYIVWCVVTGLLIYFSIIAKNEATAMTARVESRVISISFGHSIKLKKIHVIPGQTIKTGDILLEAESPDLELDLEQKKNELVQLNLEITAVNNEFVRKKKDLEFSYTQKESSINAKIDELELKLTEEEKSNQAITRITGNLVSSDTLAKFNLALAKLELNTLKSGKVADFRSLTGLRNDQLSILNSKRAIIERELNVLKIKMDQLNYRAESDGIIGNVFVDSNELASSFKKLLTIYEETPSQIRAFVNEAQAATLNVGDGVLVRASNREVSVSGIIEEIGSRVTNYPMSINPGNNRYGQEIFIRIPTTHSFLDGEQVFVYSTAKQK